MNDWLCILFEQIGKQHFFLPPESKTGQPIRDQLVHLSRQIYLTFSSILNDNIFIQIKDDPLIHGKMLDDVIHVDAAHADQITVNGIYVVDQVEGQERDVDALPADGLEEVEQGLTELDDA